MLVKGPGADPYVSLLGDRVWEASPAIRRGHETNRLELSCIGPAMSATINGVPVHTTEDHTLSGGQLALSAGATLDANSTTVEARFDNLVVLER
jgi:hypothetical protein